MMLQRPCSPGLVDVVDAVEGLQTRAGNAVHDWRQPMLHGCAQMPEQKKLQLWLITLTYTKQQGHHKQHASGEHALPSYNLALCQLANNQIQFGFLPISPTTKIVCVLHIMLRSMNGCTRSIDSAHGGSAGDRVQLIMVHNHKGALAIVCAYQVVPQIQVLDWQAGLTINI